MTTKIRDKISAGALALSFAIGPAVVPMDVGAFQNAHRGSAISMIDHRDISQQRAPAPQQHLTLTSQRRGVQPHVLQRSSVNTDGLHSQQLRINRGGELHKRGQREHWPKYGIPRRGWGGDWQGYWPLVGIFGGYFGNGINSETIDLGPNFNNSYFVVRGRRYFGECVMRVSLYDGNDIFVADIFPEQIYAPQYSRFSDLIIAAGLNRAEVRWRLAGDLCNTGIGTFE